MWEFTIPIPIVISVAFGLVYWAFEERIITYRFGLHHSIIMVLLKWGTVFGLIIEHLSIHYHVFYDKFLRIVHKGMIFVLYAIGDTVIIFNQHYSIAFFMCGHILLLGKCVLKIIVLTVEYIVGVIAFALCVTAIFAYLFKKYNEKIDHYVYGLYITYIFTLSLILITPFVAFGYFGGWFFVISDLLIGFKIKQLSKLTFPLYYASLLSLLYLFTIHD